MRPGERPWETPEEVPARRQTLSACSSEVVATVAGSLNGRAIPAADPKPKRGRKAKTA